MKLSNFLSIGSSMLVLVLASSTLAAKSDCASDSVPVGATCVDKYEASVWQIPDTLQNQGLINMVQKGRATLADLTSAKAVANGVVQHGISPAFNYPCSPNGNDCADIYAVSIPGVTPSAVITWFQAQQTCGNAGKRLLRNGEWQQAAAGTPDPGTDNDTTDCNVTPDSFPDLDPVNTGSRAACVSRWGVFDMVGNLAEWVEDWLQNNAGNDGGDVSTPLYGGDAIFWLDEAFPLETRFPAALTRGGDFLFFSGPLAGVFTLTADVAPSFTQPVLGFRCGR